MTSPVRSAPRGLKLCLAGALLLAAAAQPAHAVFVDPTIPIPTQLLNFGPIQGDAFLPLTDAAGTSTEAGAPAAVDGYGWVKSNIAISLSSQRTPVPGPATYGAAFLSVPFGGSDPAGGDQRCIEGGTPGNVNTGDEVCVQSYFDVFFDVAVTDIDTTAGYFSGLGPAQLVLLDQGPMHLSQFGSNLCIADTSQPNLGCLPVEGDAYIGHFEVVVPTGVDINGNDPGTGDPADYLDVLKFTFVQHQVGDVTDTFILPGVVQDTFDSTIDGNGLVEDAKDDPPFIFVLTGPTIAQQGIVYPAQAPEPASIALLAGGIGLLGFRRRRK